MLMKGTSTFCEEKCVVTAESERVETKSLRLGGSCFSLLQCLCSPKRQGPIIQYLMFCKCVFFHLLCPYFLCSKHTLRSSFISTLDQ